MNEDYKILFVDDEENILSSFKRQFRNKFHLATALSGQQALRLCVEQGPFTVIISDMRMPGMDGAQFLRVVSERYPETIRIMLTGNQDLETAVRAVNEGNIFRFLTKPVSSEMLEKVIQTAIKQFVLEQAEKNLLEKTLQKSIQVLVDMLSMSNPIAFSRTERLKYFMSELADKLQLRQTWEYPIAAMLSQIGCLTIPWTVVERAYGHKDMKDEERKMFQKHPEVGYDLIRTIPRLERVAEMILRQLQDCDHQLIEVNPFNRTDDYLGAEMLRASLDYDAYLSRDKTKEEALRLLKEKVGTVYNPYVIEALEKIQLPYAEKVIKKISIYDLKTGMIIREDVRSNRGSMLVPKGHKVNITVRHLLENHLKEYLVEDGVLVEIPPEIEAQHDI